MAEAPRTREIREQAATVALRYRCVCGSELKLLDSPRECPQCQRPLPTDLDDLARTRTFVIGGETDDYVAMNGGLLEETPIRPGDRFGHFEIVEPLGRGGMGAVYRALDTSLQRYVALKVIRQFGDGSTSGERRSRLKQEAVAQARLNHQHVVTIFFVGEQEGQPFFAMELVPGKNLSEVARDGVLEFFPLADIAIDTVSALLHAEHSGIVHGDIKPSNLLLDGNGQVKLGDFGLARFLSDDQRREGLSGTLDYMAPELLDGQPASYQSDMYALGATLHELSYGRAPEPLTSTTLPQRLAAQKQRTWSFPEDDRRFPEVWHSILSRLLAADPANRYDSFETLLTDLKRIRPKSLVPAGRAPRFLAYFVDGFTLNFMTFLFSIPMVILMIIEMQSQWNSELLDLGARAITPLGALLFLWIEGELRKTPGRYLFQLQVVDHHGLRPKRRTRYIRHFLRMLPSWCQVLQLIIPTGFTGLLYSAALSFVLIDALTVMFMRSGRSLIDWFCGTSVILDHATDPLRLK